MQKYQKTKDFWNLSEEKIEKIISPYFEIKKAQRIYLEQGQQYNRLYYLEKK